ncbi:MAG: hypothetical protein KME14_21530 [Tildeniella torsiva UHER 1998/13D]|jgi:hypothetical protein|nr:hypothetical protein [Tildeniella torsiva UHER 1998/13D]
MIHPGSIGGFPGDWTYQGDAKLLVGNFPLVLTIILQLVFVEEAEINIKLIWRDISKESRCSVAVEMNKVREQILIIQGGILIHGYSMPPLNTSNGTTEFHALKLITYSGLPEDISLKNGERSFTQLRAYLNDEFSSVDKIFNVKFENTPVQESEKEDFLINKESLYCCLNSGYEVKCGKKYVAHKNNGIFFRKNIDTLYNLSFIDIRVPVDNKTINSSLGDISANLAILLAQHLEELLNDLCAYLSVVCGREILPIYFEYSISDQSKFIWGRIVPIWERRRIPKMSKSWPTEGIHFLGNVTSFLECCPFNKQLSRGIGHLKLTVYESTAELKLMAACAAIEYFYSFWFRELDGLSKLVAANHEDNKLVDKNIIKRLRKLVVSKETKTPFLSTVIRFFLNDLGLDWKKYMDDSGIPFFIEIRNTIVHGDFTAEDTDIFKAEDIAKKMASEILYSVLEKVTKSDDVSLYKSLPVRPIEKELYTFSDGWSVMSDVLIELNEDLEVKTFWNS